MGERVMEELYRVVKGTLNDYVLSTSIPGLYHAGRNIHIIRKTLWLLVFFAGVILTALSVGDLVEEYFQYPVTTFVSLNHEDTLMFPAVTVCNNNPISCTKLAKFRLQYENLWKLSGCEVPDSGTLEHWLHENGSQVPAFVQDLASTCGISRFVEEKRSEGADEKILVAAGKRDISYFNVSYLTDDFDSWMELLNIIEGLMNVDPSIFTDRNITDISASLFQAIVVYGIIYPYTEKVREKHEVAQAHSNVTTDLVHRRTNEFIYEYQLLPEEVGEAVNTNWNDIIVGCTFQGSDCYDQKYFKFHLTATYGSCQMFNSYFNYQLDPSAGRRSTNLPGIAYGNDV
ncbi:unnamed protein product [Darwinula stevensoni]|uniref:Uncharacterized protein n=1 Tax=Darwinula stevensoni TaxID=69355 RepID=A0A7R9A1P2_9CRUS|nr:unnamed protein product [Darwinula stevensoni]CAG0887052.1 unnamed protein product [Darwinula stevensoni]